MDSSSLRKWKVLSGLTDEKLGNIAYLCLYGGCDRTSRAGLSALFVTHDDVVFGAGVNSLIGSDEVVNTSILICKDKDLGKTLDMCVTVDALCWLGITKIVVGSMFGAALTNNGDVYVWGSIGARMAKVKDEDIVMFESFNAKKYCKFCGKYYYYEELIGATSISKCTERCNMYPTYTISSPPPSETTVRWFVKFSDPVTCLKCMTFTSSKKVDGCDFHFCAKCNTMLEVTGNSRSLLKSTNFQAPQRLEVSEFWKICNIYCGSTFLVIETSSGHLLLWGSICDSEYQGVITNPGKVHIKSVSCGGSHLAVISSRGELYTCGLGDKGQLGYEWTDDMGHTTLRKVPLNGRVVKVCCGYTSTACLMSNGSIMCFGSNMKKLSSGIISLSSSDADYTYAPTNIMESLTFVDITYAPSTNVFCAKTENCMVFIWGKCKSKIPKVLFEVVELAEALADLPYAYIDASRSKDPIEKFLLQLCSQEYEILFANERFSDLTLKLADGDFPVHRVVLVLNSLYFKNILSNKECTSDVLDMSVYNPTSYKCLLKYFYRLPFDDLNCEDLFDLYMIAKSYKEKELIDFTFEKLKAVIDQDTVLKLHAKATFTKSEELLHECELFLSSPEFKSDIVSFVSQDMKNAIALLRMKSGE